MPLLYHITPSACESMHTHKPGSQESTVRRKGGGFQDKDASQIYTFALFFSPSPSSRQKPRQKKLNIQLLYGIFDK